jgi:transcriptional regulator with XRE-family HTH domain
LRFRNIFLRKTVFLLLFFNLYGIFFLQIAKGGVIFLGNFNRVDSTANRIKAAMHQAGKKQVDIVKETGINRSAISRYLSGEYEPKQDAIHKIAKCLNVSEMWLWGYECPMERPAAQKNNDVLSDIVVRMRTDKNFASVLEGIAKLNPEQLASVKQIVSVLLKG